MNGGNGAANDNAPLESNVVEVYEEDGHWGVEHTETDSDGNIVSSEEIAGNSWSDGGVEPSSANDN